MSAKSKYLAGASTAETDRKRGMSLADMGMVPQDTDDPDWVYGYYDRLTAYLASASNNRPKED